MKCTGMDWGVTGSYVLTAKFSHHSNDDYEVLKDFLNLQDPVLFLRTFQVLENEHFFQ